MRLHEIQKKEKDDWVHVRFVPLDLRGTEKFLKRIRDDDRLGMYRIIPYRRLDDEIRTYMPRII